MLTKSSSCRLFGLVISLKSNSLSSPKLPYNFFFKTLNLGRRVQIRKAPQCIPDPVPERKRSTPINPANTIRRTHANNAVSQRPYRDRVIHLLALKTYKKPELLARLQRDGVNLKDRNSLTAILQQVRSWLPAFFLLLLFF